MEIINNKNKICGGILPAVLVLSLLMLLGVWGAFILLDGETLFLWKIQYNRAQWANLESACLLYKNDSLFISRLEADCSYVLYPEKPSSRIYASVSLWGLYEKLLLKGEKKRPVSSRLLGTVLPFTYTCSLYYPDCGHSLWLTGNTTLEGVLLLPLNGLKTSQMGWEFFSGEPPGSQSLFQSGPSLPEPLAPVRNHTDSLLQMKIGAGDGLERTGNIIVGQRIVLNENVVVPPDVLVIGKTIVVEEGTSLTAQLFATDTILLKKRATLQYPSGLFMSRKNPDRYIEIQAESAVNGYVIVDGTGEDKHQTPQYSQAEGATVRGLLYVNGTASLHGMVHGAVFISRSVFYTSDTYYNHTLYHFLLLAEKELAYPVWMKAPYKKREIKWINDQTKQIQNEE